MNKYDDIINLPHYEPKNHPRMSIASRSAQFAPFSALTGFKEEIIETGREISKKKQLSETRKERIDNLLNFIKMHLKNHLNGIVTFYDKNESKYITLNDSIKKIDLIKKEIILNNNIRIKIDNLYELKILDYDFDI